jgi:hypothetical protein
MTIIAIKSTKPFVEKVIQGKFNGKDLKENITIGVKVYDGSELESIKEHYLNNLSSAKITRWQKQLEALPEDLTLSEEVFEEKLTYLESSINNWTKNFTKNMEDFCKQNVSYIKNASLVLEEGGKNIDLLITDTREAKPIESLWATPDECLAVLLDMYLEHPAYKDSLQLAIPKLVFNTDFLDGELKN